MLSQVSGRTAELLLPRLCYSLAALVLATGCSSTTPESIYPPPGPASGLPYAPFPEVNDLDDEEIDEDADEDGQTDASASVQAVSDALPAAPATLNRTSDCSKKLCTLTTWLPTDTWAADVGETPVVLWSQKIPSGNTVVIPRNSQLEVYVLGSSGKTLATGDDGGVSIAVQPWTLVRISGGGVSLKATADSVSTIAIVSSKGSLNAARAAAKAKPWEARWKKRPAAIESVELGSVAAVPYQAGALQVRVAFNKSPRRLASFSLLKGGPALQVPSHAHQGEWEHVALLHGAGSMTLGKQTLSMVAGSLAHIPAGEEHSFRATGSDPVVAIQLYSPPGPERRFLTEPRAAATAPPPATPKTK